MVPLLAMMVIPASLKRSIHASRSATPSTSTLATSQADTVSSHFDINPHFPLRDKCLGVGLVGGVREQKWNEVLRRTDGLYTGFTSSMIKRSNGPSLLLKSFRGSLQLELLKLSGLIQLAIGYQLFDCRAHENPCPFSCGFPFPMVVSLRR